jgi:hypothetical protein
VKAGAGIARTTSFTKHTVKAHRCPFSRTIAAGILIGLGFTVFSWRLAGRKPLLGDAPGAHLRVMPDLAQESDATAGRVAESIRWSLMYVLPPLWLSSSLADWACHRYSRIEETTGVKESLIHLLLLGEMGIPVLATAFLEITSPVILTMMGSFLVHEATVYCDLRIAVAEREVTPIEQMVHSFMEMLPLVGIWLVSLLREEELRALVGTSARSPDISLRLKEKPLPIGYRAGLLTAIALFGGIPYIEELWRTARAAAREQL